MRRTLNSEPTGYKPVAHSPVPQSLELLWPVRFLSEQNQYVLRGGVGEL